MNDAPGAVRLDVDGALAHLVVSRPHKRNALDPAAAADLDSALGALEEAVAAGRVRAAVVTGQGPAFCAGRDITGVDPAAEDPGRVLADVFNPLVQRLAGLPVPTVAAVEGPALGVGLGLALACDLVVAAEDAKFGSPFARLGAVLDSGAHLLLAERIGRPRTLELVYTGRLLTGAEAHAWGLVTATAPPGRALDEADALARTLADGPTLAFAASKRLLGRLRDEGLDLAAVLAAEADAQRTAGSSADYAEGFAAFAAKRAPRFTGA